MLRELLLLCFIISFTATRCDVEEMDHTDVDKFIQQLIDGAYDNPDLPAFNTGDILALLEHRSDTTVITNFPHNPISSLYLEECRLGTFVLWTIESIRAVEIQSEYLFNRFPSLNPALYFSHPDLLMPFHPEEAHWVAAEAYLAWWSSDKTTEEKLNTDPMAGTGYGWK